jgi:RNA polymerase sigma-70 factor (ECF subfamily)
MDGVNAATNALGSRAAGSGRASFAEIAERELDSVFRFLVYLTGDRGLAEDLAGETFERAFRTWRRYDPRRARPRTWLCQIARSVALDHLRAERRRRRREETYERGRGEVDPGELGDGLSPALERALRALSPAEREVVALRVLLDLDGPAAARVLRISATACSTRLSRALKKLEEEMTRDDA